MYADPTYNISTNLTPPLYFLFVDKNSIESMYNQIQPDLIKQRTSIHDENKLGIDARANVGPAEISGHLYDDSSVTTEFTKIQYGYSRQAIEVIHHCISNNNVVQYTVMPDWMNMYVRQILKSRLNVKWDMSGNVDYITLPTTPINVDLLKSEGIQKAFAEEMNHLSGYILLVSKNCTYSTSDCSELVIPFTNDSKDFLHVTFAVSLPDEWKSLHLNFPVLDLRIFGVVIKGLDADGYIHVRPIAIFK
jgi:hypothetical protein